MDSLHQEIISINLKHCLCLEWQEAVCFSYSLCLLQLIRRCRKNNPAQRPTFEQVKKMLYKMNPNKVSPVDMMMTLVNLLFLIQSKSICSLAITFTSILQVCFLISYPLLMRTVIHSPLWADCSCSSAWDPAFLLVLFLSVFLNFLNFFGAENFHFFSRMSIAF